MNADRAPQLKAIVRALDIPDRKEATVTDVTFPNGFYLSDRLMKPGPNYRAFTFINSEYIEKGAALFGRETEASLQDFREAIGSAVDDADDQEIYAIIQFAVQRVRMIRKICSLKAARYKYASIDGEMDRERFPICALMDGKYFRVGIAALNLETFAQLSIEEQASILNRACDRAADENFVKGIAFEEGGIIPDFLIGKDSATLHFIAYVLARPSVSIKKRSTGLIIRPVVALS